MEFVDNCYLFCAFYYKHSPDITNKYIVCKVESCILFSKITFDLISLVERCSSLITIPEVKQKSAQI